jgi:hypothetical protein
LTGDPRNEKWQDILPECIGVVPELDRGPFDTTVIEGVLKNLREQGSVAAPGYMQPEGIIVYHIAGNVSFKKTLDKDDEPKGVR